MTQEEFEHIAPALRELMLSVGRSFFGNDDDAEDVAQEGLVALLRFIDRMDSASKHEALAIRVISTAYLRLLILLLNLDSILCFIKPSISYDVLCI